MKTLCSTSSALILGALLFGSAQAQTVWRCDAAGRTVYTDTPCADGRTVDAADARSAEQVLAARQLAAAIERQAQSLVRERLRREPPSSGLAGIRSSEFDALRKPSTLARHKAALRPEEASTWPSAVRLSRRGRD